MKPKEEKALDNNKKENPKENFLDVDEAVMLQYLSAYSRTVWYCPFHLCH